MRTLLLSALALGAFTAIAFAAPGCSSSSDNNGGADGGNGEDAPSANPPKLGFTPSNLSLGNIDVTGLGDFVADRDCTLRSDEDENPCSEANVTKFTLVTQNGGGQKVGVYLAKSFRINANVTVKTTGEYPIALVALDKIEILGHLSAAAVGYTQAAGGAASTATNENGVGLGGGAAGKADSNAGGGGSFCGVGGKGPAQAGLNGVAASGGQKYGNATLTPLVGGSSGGAGAIVSGGAGGGAIQLVAANSIAIGASGTINVGGGGGARSGADDDSKDQSSGGGSGGAILLEAGQVDIAGILAANGGGGGGGGTDDENDGENGTTQRAGQDVAAAKGGKSKTENHGGDGSAGVFVNGADGVGTSVASANGGAGGGGGGAGWIRINTRTGSATITGVLSPTLSTTAAACATQGPLTP
ncbi:hypothetical protein LZC95_22030 [Pendulispora brunnea]|uniref:Uncharacterized protein n=1 Tax=Pendulispora brunnea TaxID=2905690 RepID=A0ABZ2KR18_9BACT